MIDEETYKQQMRAKQGKRKIRQKGSNDDFALAKATHIGRSEEHTSELQSPD